MPSPLRRLGVAAGAAAAALCVAGCGMDSFEIAAAKKAVRDHVEHPKTVIFRDVRRGAEPMVCGEAVEAGRARRFLSGGQGDVTFDPGETGPDGPDGAIQFDRLWGRFCDG